jgi:hypothetical protein
VWYPVDQSSITGATPSASYPLDPLYEVIPSAGSPHFEQYGIDPAYHEVAASAKRPFPVLLFSPGWGAAAWQHASVAARLASHGFVVAVLYHFGDQWWPWEPPFDHIALASFNRPRDVSFVLTDLLVKNSSSGHLLAGTMRADQVAAGGWSLGGYAAMVLAGGDDSVCTELADVGFGPPPESTCAPSYPDPRIKAIVPLDGSGWILRFDELARIRVPNMGIGQEWTQVLDWHTREHAAIQGHPSYRVDVFNSNHQLFSDICEDVYVLRDLGVVSQEFADEWFEWLCTGVTPSSVVHRLSNQYATAFLKTELAREAGYANMLTPGWALTRETLIEFFVTEKRNPNAISDDWPGFYIYFKHQPGSEQARAEKEPATKRPVPRMSLSR